MPHFSEKTWKPESYQFKQKMPATILRGGARTMGPFAFVHSTAVRGPQSEPHHRWGTGFLYDNISTKDDDSLAYHAHHAVL